MHPHPQDRDPLGTFHQDPISDTDPTIPNLMDNGASTAITAEQARVLSKSPLLALQ